MPFFVPRAAAYLGVPSIQDLAGLAVVAALAAFAAQWPIRLVDVDGITLRVALPATLAFVLSFAPRPASRVGRIARELTVLGLCAGMFAGDRLPMLLAWLIRFPYLGGAFQRLSWLTIKLWRCHAGVR